MSEAHLASIKRSPRLFRRIGFDSSLEATAFGCLAELDVEGCRSALGRLVDQLDLSDLQGNGPAVVLLLADVLHKINRRVNRPASDDATYQLRRAALLEQFSACSEPEEARRVFLPALARVLAPLTRGRRSAHPLIDRAKAYIEQNYTRRLSLSSVALHLHLSSNYLSRLFRRETGMTLTAYIHQLRLEHARLLLAEGERSISEIAYLVGYQNYRDFYRNFVKFENASPRQVQRRLSPPSGG